MESIQIAIQVYFIAFCTALVIAAVIKGLLIVIKWASPKKQIAEE